MASTYTGWKSGVDLIRNMWYRRANEVHHTFRFSEGTSNPLVEYDNEDAVKEEDVGADNEAKNIVLGFESEPDLVRQFRPNGLEVEFF